VLPTAKPEKQVTAVAFNPLKVGDCYSCLDFNDFYFKSGWPRTLLCWQCACKMILVCLFFIHSTSPVS